MALLSFVVSHIQRIGCQPEKNTLHGGQSRSWSAEQGREKRNKRENLEAHPHPTPTLLLLLLIIIVLIVL